MDKEVQVCTSSKLTIVCLRGAVTPRVTFVIADRAALYTNRGDFDGRSSLDLYYTERKKKRIFTLNNICIIDILFV